MSATTETVDAQASGLPRALRDAWPLLAAVGLLMAGNGLTGTLLGVRAGLEGFGPTVTGVVLAGYYAGFLVGSLVTPSTIMRVGHVRVFAGLASLASTAVLIHVLRRDPTSWFALRALSGMCISGLYVVTETWLNGAATNRTRGSLLASYMVVVSGGLLSGQLLFSVADPRGFGAFVLASILVSLAVVPLSLSRVSVPTLPDPSPLSMRQLIAVAPLAPVGAALSGFTAAAMVGAGAVYAVEAGLGRGGTAALIGAALAGGLVLQVPLGRLSDLVDRRGVIVVTGLGAALLSLAAASLGPDRIGAVIAVTVLAGGAAFPLYSLSNAHLNDYLDQQLVVAAGARMVLVNGIGSIGGPIVGAFAVDAAGPGGLFVVLAAGYVVVALYAAWRITRRAAVEPEERATFSPLPITSSPTVAMFEGDIANLYPLTEAQFERDGQVVRYEERGAGEAVVLVADSKGPPATWDDVLPALAANGMRAVVRRSAASPDPEERIPDLILLLRELDLPYVTLVGEGDGADVVARFAEEHPERLDAAVFLGVERALPEGTSSLVVDPALLDDEPDLVADLIVDFLRHR